MIDELHVTNLALIREADLSLSSGLTVLTGETGAGKTALLSALKLLLGERSDASLVREGEASAQVEARFFNGALDTEGFTVTRRIGSDGRSRVRIDGGLGSVRELAARTAPLMDLCGQHEHQRLLDAATHVGMVDAWAHAGIAGALEAYRRDLAAARAAARELERVEAAARTEGFQLEDARFAVDRIDEVAPREGELEELEETLPRAEHAEALAACAHEASEALSGEGGALDPLNGAIAELSRMGSVDEKLAEFADALAGAAITLEDVASDLRRYRDSVDFDPEGLARKQERYAELKGLLRRLGRAWRTCSHDVRRPRSCWVSSRTAMRAFVAPARLSMRRRTSSPGRQGAASPARRVRPAVLPRGGPPDGAPRDGEGRARVGCPAPAARALERAGPDQCELLYRSGPGLTPRPLRRIASGGELSRVMLAATVVLGETDGVDTLVFDEVDAGVGGSTAVALADVLADLARTHQVIVVTHLAQVAVRGEAHYVVRKAEGAGGMPETDLRRLAEEERPAEIARMLSGDATEASLAHAREMLARARG